METKRCQRCHKLLRIDARICSRCGGRDFTQVAATRSRQTIKLTSRAGEMSFPSNPPASPHRAGHFSGLHPEDQPYQSSFLPALQSPAPLAYAIVEEPEDLSLATAEDAFATMPQAEPEFFDAPAAKRHIATFTPLPQPRQQRSLQVYTAPPAESYAPASLQNSTEIYHPELPAPTTKEPAPITLKPGPRRTRPRGGIIPILLVLSCFSFLVATSILVFLLVSNNSTLALTPVVYAEPSGSLRVGDTTIISGSRFPANALLHFTRDSNKLVLDQSRKPLEVNAYHSGNFSVQIKITQDWSVGPHTIFAADQQNNTASVTISIIGQKTTPPQLQLSIAHFDMGAGSSGAITLKDLALANAGGGQVRWKTSSDATWLSANPTSGAFSGSEDVKVTANRGTLPAGSYTGHLKFTELNSHQSLTLTVTMAISPSPPTLAAANLVLSSAALTFSGTPAQNPAGQALALQNTGGQSLDWTASATTIGGGNWLAVSSSSGSLAAGDQTTVTVSAVSAGLSAGTYAGTLTFTYGGVTKSAAVTLQVSLPPMPALVVQPTSLTFNAIQGQNPLPQSFTINNPGSAPLNWSITEDANGTAYAHVSPAQGTLGTGQSATITVTPSITQLGPQTINASITVKDTDPGTTVKSQQIAVTFKIVNQAVISLNANQMSFNTTSIIQVSTQLLTVTNTGSAPLNWSLTVSNSSPVQWLAVDNTGGTLASGGTIALINVTCDSTHLSPGTFTATLKVVDTDSGTPVAPQTVTVTLVVS